MDTMTRSQEYLILDKGNCIVAVAVNELQKSPENKTFGICAWMVGYSASAVLLDFSRGCKFDVCPHCGTQSVDGDTCPECMIPFHTS